MVRNNEDSQNSKMRWMFVTQPQGVSKNPELNSASQGSLSPSVSIVGRFQRKQTYLQYLVHQCIYKDWHNTQKLFVQLTLNWRTILIRREVAAEH